MRKRNSKRGESVLVEILLVSAIAFCLFMMWFVKRDAFSKYSEWTNGTNGTNETNETLVDSTFSQIIVEANRASQ